MGLETYLRIFAVDNTGKRKYTKQQIEKLWNEELEHDPTASVYGKGDKDYTDSPREMPPFLVVRNPPDADSKKYKYLPSQKEDPFPIWIDTATGNEAYEIMDVNFLSDFDELYKHYHLEGCHDCCEITLTEVHDMLAVLNYILREKYDRDIEEYMFEDNEFFRLFEDQFFNFKMRFRRNKPRVQQQTIRVIITDKRSNVETDEGYDEETDDWELIEERRESERDERRQIERLKDVLTAFLYMREPDYVENPKVIYKIGYFLSY